MMSYNGTLYMSENKSEVGQIKLNDYTVQCRYAFMDHFDLNRTCVSNKTHNWSSSDVLIGMSEQCLSGWHAFRGSEMRHHKEMATRRTYRPHGEVSMLLHIRWCATRSFDIPPLVMQDDARGESGWKLSLKRHPMNLQLFAKIVTNVPSLWE